LTWADALKQSHTQSESEVGNLRRLKTTTKKLTVFCCGNVGYMLINVCMSLRSFETHSPLFPNTHTHAGNTLQTSKPEHSCPQAFGC